jgi:hypothetical protein
MQHAHAAHRTLKSMWRGSRHEPLVDVDRAVLVTVHHQTAVLILAAMRPLLQGHVLLVLTGMTHPGRIAFVDDIEFFPKCRHL